MTVWVWPQGWWQSCLCLGFSYTCHPLDFGLKAAVACVEGSADSCLESWAALPCVSTHHHSSCPLSASSREPFGAFSLWPECKPLLLRQALLLKKQKRGWAAVTVTERHLPLFALVFLQWQE